MTMNPIPTVSLESILRPTRDALQAAKTLDDNEIRFLVDAYYQLQDYRKASTNQIRSIDQGVDEGPVSTGGHARQHQTLDWLAVQLDTMENQIKRALDVYSQSHEAGPWLRSVYGIGPVIAAGLVSHINIERAPTVGHIWRFAGLDPTVRWPSREQSTAYFKGQSIDELTMASAAAEYGRAAQTLIQFASHDRTGKPVKMTPTTASAALSRRPWNTQLKTLTWKVGQSFMKFSGQAECYYGAVYKQRKAYEIERNVAGNPAIAAAVATGLAKVGKTTDGIQALFGRHAAASADRRPRSTLRGEVVPEPPARGLVHRTLRQGASAAVSDRHPRARAHRAAFDELSQSARENHFHRVSQAHRENQSSRASQAIGENQHH
jgi:hypothetical protein